jgi:hypothetical protein
VQRLHEAFFTKLQKQSSVDPGTAGVSPAVFR